MVPNYLLARSKRKCASTDDDTTPTADSTPDDVKTSSSEDTSIVAKRRRKKNVVVEPRDEHLALTYKTPRNPQATFEGLPAEIRLQIYDYLCDSSIIHVHKHQAKTIPGNDGHNDKQPTCFTWTPCRSPSPKSPLLCANPKWSGMCKEEDRCTYKLYSPPEVFGFWALAASSKAIRNEAQEFFLRRTVISIHPENLRPWLDHLAKHSPRQIDYLRRITLAGPNTHNQFLQSQVQLLHDRVPKLSGVGFQSQDPIWRWVTNHASGEPQILRQAWKQWNILEWMQIFDSSVTVELEATMWYKHSHWRTVVVERQFAVRVLRKEGGGWNEGNVQVEYVEPGKLAEPRMNAKWRAWWDGQGMQGTW
jgi:hypothetical protein